MEHGIHENPGWYPGLSPSSSFVDFQALMHASGHGHGTCPEPCAPSDSCHTAVEGDDCFGHVVWAITTGIHQYPQWYPGLSRSSTFVDFQNSMHLTGHGFGTCPVPCEIIASTSTNPTADSTTTAQETDCRTALAGDECYGHVMWAMEVGIYQHPDWYPGLSSSSTFAEFQASMHASGHGYGTCPAPCNNAAQPSTSTTTVSADACHTAVEADECYGHVLWAIGTGIHSFPAWYPGLSPQSSFVDFQASMHLSGHGFGTCPQPCHGLGERRLADVKIPRGKSALRGTTTTQAKSST